MFEPRLALSSLSGQSDAAWAKNGVPHAGLAILGGIAIDEQTRAAARKMVEDRDREEFLPADPIGFVDRELSFLSEVSIRTGINVRTRTPGPLERVADICAEHDALLEINAHCRQEEMCAVGAGESLLSDVDRLESQVRTAVSRGATVSVKVRCEVPGVDLPAVCRRVERAGADVIHVDAMDSEWVLGDIDEKTDAFLIGNNGVRDRSTAVEYLEYGADAVSVGRPSDDPVVLSRVSRAVQEYFD
ncbi:MAG: tRNA-dihydrouridine synthase [Halodesulfurarchaeum sp.]